MVDIIAWKGFCNSFEKLGRKAERKALPKVDIYAEKRRLNLLNKKRDLLGKLLQAHTNELRMHGMPPPATPPNYKMIRAEFDSGSQASMATFRSRDSRGEFRKPVVSTRPRFVPALKIPSSSRTSNGFNRS